MRRVVCGFTLVEMLVSIALMGLLGTLSWRALDVITATHHTVTLRDKALERVDLALTQWVADLSALQATGIVPSLSYDGDVLRLTRTEANGGSYGAGLQVVAWTLKGKQWRRWASRGVSSSAALYAEWQQAANFSSNRVMSPPALTLSPALNWRVLYYRDGNWFDAHANRDEYAGSASDAPRFSVPAGVRLELQVDEAPFSAGVLRRDWARAVTPFGGAW